MGKMCIRDSHPSVLAQTVNDSMIHEDFMIGSQDMDIDGLCEDGRVVPIFRKGNWAF